MVFKNRKLNILVIPCTEWLRGSQQRFHHLSKEWSKRNNVYAFYLERYDDVKFESNFSEREQYSALIRIPTIKVKNYPFFLLLNFLLQFIFFVRIIKNNKIDVLVAEGLGPSNAASIASKIMKRRFIFDYSDCYASLAASYISNSSLKKIIQYSAILMTHINIKLSNATVVVSDGLLASVTNLLKKHKIVNGVSEDYFPVNQEIDESNDGTVTISFMGAIESWVNFEMVMNAIINLNKENNSKVVLKIIGDGSKLSKVKKRASQKGLGGSVIFTGWVPYTRLHEYIRNSDICILPFDNSCISTLSMPMKIHEYAISKKPIITAPLPEIKKMYGSSVIYATAEQEYMRGITLLLEDKELRVQLVEEAYRIAKKYSWNIIAERYEKLLSLQHNVG